MKPEFAVFYQVYKNEKATRFVLENFRKHFPYNTVVLISDGGDDFSSLAKEYDCSFHMKENIFGNSENNYNVHCYDSKRTIEWWSRHKLVSEYTSHEVDYVMILEDDVFVQDKFCINPPFALRGTRTGMRLRDKMLEEIKEKAGYDADIYGMCGGAIYNSKILLLIYDDVVKDIEENMDRLIEEDYMQWALTGAVDANMTYHFNKRGYKYDTAPWLGEVREGNFDYPVIHQWKENY